MRGHPTARGTDAIPALAGGGELGERIRSLDWTATSLGPIAGWSRSLTTSLSLILNSRMPMWIGWGRELVFFYNDAYVQVLGDAKHPWALGRPAAEVWAEIWDVCGPLAEEVFTGVAAPFVEDVRLFMSRGDRLEEVYYSFCYSPIRGESGEVAGLFCPNNEVTAKLLNARRLRTLSELAARSLLEKTTAAACASAAATLARNPDDVPFALLYLGAAEGPLRLEQAVRLPAGVPGYSPRVAREGERLRWPLFEALRGAGRGVVELGREERLPRGLADQPVARAVILPVAAAGQERPVGVMVVGVNPTRALDAEYEAFFELVAAQVAAAIQNATAAEQERRRADALAELDRAKTAFFSNISHEFRTPLTLMIGPTEDALAGPDPALRGEALATVHRNELRLLKLVNALLDFSRLEAGRMAASLEPVDLAALTVDLASGFRAAVEGAGLSLIVEVPAEPVAAHVDRDMWETIVLNLLSNALKFTLAGEIRVGLRRVGERVVLQVADTGSGIAAAEMPRLFERFHRIENPRARTQEGSGIGLALVQELTRLHGGTIAVDSEVGRGTEFRVVIPAVHEGAARAASPASVRASRARAARVEEARRWTTAAGRLAPETGAGAEHVLVADDNADMRDYLGRLLAEHWRVTTVADGAAALEVARRELPDLVLTDVMMPRVDGFAVLAALRDDPRTRSIPVLMVSARAGDEARVEGLDAGADDYLVKPFSARELVARVRTHLTLAALRRRSERDLAELYALFMQVPAAIAVYRGPELTCVFQNAADLAGGERRGGLPDADPQRAAILREVVGAGETRVRREVPARRGAEVRYLDETYAPLRLSDGWIDGVVAIGLDVTERRVAEAGREAAQQRLFAALEASAIGTYFWDVRSDHVEHDEGLRRLFAFGPGEGDALADYTARIHEDDREAWLSHLERSARDGCEFHLEYRVVAPDGGVRWMLDKGRISRDAAGRPTTMVGAVVDISEPRRLAELAVAASRAKDEFLALLGHELRNPLAPIVTAVQLLMLRGGGEATKEVQMIERQVRHLTRLVDDLLDISRVTRGLVELRCERVGLADVLAKAVEIAGPLIEQKGHALAVEAAPGLWIEGDPVRLAQVFANLLTNAARYSPRCGRIAVRAAAEAGWLVVRVVDAGIGIPAEMLGRIFELFVQGRGTRDRGEGGLGIGLALVQTLVRMHGGEVSAHSEGPGRGSEFVVRLPASRAAPVPVRGLARAPALPRGGRRVMVVDDNVDAAEALSDALAELGYAVAVAHDGPQALALVEGFRPEVAVLDLGMPEMDGYELIRRLRERGLGSCRMVALTGYGQEQDRRRSREAGFDAHLIKPVDLDRLARVVAG